MYVLFFRIIPHADANQSAIPILVIDINEMTSKIFSKKYIDLKKISGAWKRIYRTIEITREETLIF